MALLDALVLETEDSGAVSAYVPGLPIYAAAETQAKAERAIRAVLTAYLHTHPAEEASGDQLGGPEIRFGTTFPTAGLYRLYPNFAHDGEVRTAEFTVEVLEGSGTPAVSPDEGDSASTEPSPPPSDVHSGH